MSIKIPFTKNKWSLNPINASRLRIYKNLNPVFYDVSALKDAVLYNKQDPYRNANIYRNDIFAEYLQIPQQFRDQDPAYEKLDRQNIVQL